MPFRRWCSEHKLSLLSLHDLWVIPLPVYQNHTGTCHVPWHVSDPSATSFKGPWMNGYCYCTQVVCRVKQKQCAYLYMSKYILSRLSVNGPSSSFTQLSLPQRQEEEQWLMTSWHCPWLYKKYLWPLQTFYILDSLDNLSSWAHPWSYESGYKVLECTTKVHSLTENNDKNWTMTESSTPLPRKKTQKKDQIITQTTDTSKPVTWRRL